MALHFRVMRGENTDADSVGNLVAGWRSTTRTHASRSCKAMCVATRWELDSCGVRAVRLVTSPLLIPAFTRPSNKQPDCALSITAFAVTAHGTSKMHCT